MSQDIKNELASLDIGSQVRSLRNQRNLTLQELSELTGLSKPNLSQIENNIVTTQKYDSTMFPRIPFIGVNVEW